MPEEKKGSRIGLVIMIIGACVLVAIAVVVLITALSGGSLQVGTPVNLVAIIGLAVGLVLLVVGLIVLLTRRTKPQPAPEQAVVDEEPVPVVLPDEVEAEQLPFVPADQAVGYGWARAADLANRQNSSHIS
ncbi:MAG: hypothetical protein FWF25_07340 [Propionibacteriaceae bacterium]|nr:hypothetical protein [Propionibacteriaceae bacterium]